MFNTLDVLSVTTGKLLSMDGIYELYEHVLGHPVWTHMLPELRSDVRVKVLAQHPHLAAADAEAENVTPENVDFYQQLFIERYGAELVLVGPDNPDAPEA
jgi:hypothetical protein